MFSFEFNKLAGALLGACVFAMGLGIAAEAIYSGGKPVKAGYELPEAKTETVAEKPAPSVPLPVLLAKADTTKGQADIKVCQACHNFEKGAGAKVGPALYGVIDRAKASVTGFDYSAGLKAKGGNWTYDDINQFLTNPKTYITGTKMGYAGEADAGKRADIIAYLRTLSDAPAPLPAVTDAAPAKAGGTEPAKPAEAPAPNTAPAKTAELGKQGSIVTPAPAVNTATLAPAATTAPVAATMEPYHGVDPVYPERTADAAPAALPVVSPTSAASSPPSAPVSPDDSPPQPYKGADPHY